MKVKKFTFKKYEVSAYIKAALDFLCPPEDMTVSEWAEKYRILDEKSSHMPGSWKNSITPYLKDIMDEFNNYETEKIIFAKPTQVGGTEVMLNIVGYVVTQDPSPMMVVYPTDTLAETISDNRIQPMIDASPVLRKKFKGRGSTKTELQFDNMYISLAGSNSPSGLASKPIRYLLLDEVDKFPHASRKEADPISLAEERTKTFPNRKEYLCSTPTIRNGHIWKAKEEADVEKHYFVPCPHCGEYIELKFAQIRWPGKETDMSDIDRAEFANYVCQECGCIITDQNKPQMLKNGKWQVIRKNTQFVRSVAFWINTLYSPFTRFSEIAKEFMQSKDDPDKLHNFTNSWLAEPWEDTKLKTNADIVMERKTNIPEFVVPDWAKLITGGIDVQENCLYWTIRAWGDFLTSQNITHGQAFSFSEITKIMNLEYKKTDNTPMLVDLALIDSGDQTDDVYDYCAQNAEWALPCKGTPSMLNHYKLSTVNKAASKAYGMNLVLIDGGKYKDMIASRMRKENGKGSWMVYKDCDLEYAQQVTAEHKIIERGGAGLEKMKWVLKSSHADNHYLDAEVYAMAAADILGVRTLFLQNDSEKVKEESPNPANEDMLTKQEQSEWLSNTNEWI